MDFPFFFGAGGALTYVHMTIISSWTRVSTITYSLVADVLLLVGIRNQRN